MVIPQLTDTKDVGVFPRAHARDRLSRHADCWVPPQGTHNHPSHHPRARGCTRMSKPEQPRSSSALSRYLSDIRTFPLLSKEQEIQIGQRISRGMREGQDELVLSNLGFVVKIATEYQNMGL